MNIHFTLRRHKTKRQISKKNHHTRLCSIWIPFISNEQFSITTTYITLQTINKRRNATIILNPNSIKTPIPIKKMAIPKHPSPWTFLTANGYGWSPFMRDWSPRGDDGTLDGNFHPRGGVLCSPVAFPHPGRPSFGPWLAFFGPAFCQ